MRYVLQVGAKNISRHLVPRTRHFGSSTRRCSSPADATGVGGAGKPWRSAAKPDSSYNRTGLAGDQPTTILSSCSPHSTIGFCNHPKRSHIPCLVVPRIGCYSTIPLQRRAGFTPPADIPAKRGYSCRTAPKRRRPSCCRRLVILE